MRRQRRQPCRICQRPTVHEVYEDRGRGRIWVDAARCLEHQESTTGQIDVRDPFSGVWETVQQMIYVNRTANMVAAKLSSWPLPQDATKLFPTIAAFDEIAASLT